MDEWNSRSLFGISCMLCIAFLALHPGRSESAETTLRCSPGQSTDFPIVLSYTIKNASAHNYHFWSPVGCPAPKPRYFRAEVLVDGKLHFYFPANRNYSDYVACHNQRNTIEPGESMTLYFVLTNLALDAYFGIFHFHKMNWSFPTGAYSVRITYVGPTRERGSLLLPLESSNWVNFEVDNEPDTLHARRGDVWKNKSMKDFIAGDFVTDLDVFRNLAGMFSCEPGGLKSRLNWIDTCSSIDPSFADLMLQIYLARRADSSLSFEDRCYFIHGMLDVLQRTPTKEIADLLIEISGATENQSERLYILENLSAFPFKSSICFLIAMTADEDKKTRILAASSLCKMGLLEGLGPMLELAREGDTSTLGWAIEHIWLLRRTVPGRKVIESLLRSQDEAFAKRAKEHIDRIRNEASWYSGR